MPEEKYSRLDRAFAAFLGRQTVLEPKDNKLFTLIVSELSCSQNQGHNCIRLDERQQELMHRSGLVSEQGRTPLILEQNRLYLHRYWFYETRLARCISEISGKQAEYKNLEQALNRFFQPQPDDIDWQRIAAKSAVCQSFSIITGGPGTGKTTTVVKILALLQELHPKPLLIALAAPTGKAAMRLQESISSSKQHLPGSEQFKALIPETATTLHRLLGVRPLSSNFIHHSENPLPYDVIVIDEASMIDLALMSKLADALKENVRLILLGDKDQLASVESGAVLADLTASLPDNTLQLRKSFRFEENIKNLATAVNWQQHEKAWQLLTGGHDNIGLLRENFISYIADQLETYLGLIKQGSGINLIFKSLNAFQVLCAVRHGTYGVKEINRQVELMLEDRQMIHLSGLWYSGRPVMVTQNDYSLHLYNGDIGICLPDPDQSGKLMVFFERPDGSIKKCLPTRLPHCDTVFAMTIHKSQGSEFNEVVIILPDAINPILTKELIYTAITRAKKSLHIVCNPSVFTSTIQQKVERFGGLASRFSREKSE